MSQEAKTYPSVMREITPLSDNDCFYLTDRNKSKFDFPIHSHPEYELNYIGNGAGVRRTVGDHSDICVMVCTQQRRDNSLWDAT